MTPSNICPHCHGFQRSATTLHGKPATEDPDSLIICGGCGGLIKREGKMQRKATAEEIAAYEAASPACWARIVEVQRLIRRQQQ